MRTSLLLLTLAAGCTPSAEGLFMVHAMSMPATPIANEDVTYDLHVMDAGSDADISGGTVVVVPWMTAHEHGIMGDAVVTDEGDGHYATTFQFTMPGAWELQIGITDADGRSDDVVVAVTVE